METSERALPEPIIHHIQSFMTGKEAARTILISKSWHNAWLTRPTLDFSIIDFNRTRTRFSEFTTKTMQRYQHLNLKIHSLRLQLSSRLPKRCDVDELLIRSLAAAAIEIGATDLDLNLNEMMLPPEVLASETLVRLSLRSCEFNGNYSVRCSNLQSLKLECIFFEGDDVVLFRNIISCCVSIEELSLFKCNGLTLIPMNLQKLRKLRRLLLFRMEVDDVFFDEFASRFPCLNHLSLVECGFNGRIHIVSSSLQHICLRGGHSRALFDVPNLRKFSYGFSNLRSSLSIEESGSRNWEFEISITSPRLEATPWFLKLKKFLSEFEQRTRISLSVSLRSAPNDQSERDVFVHVVPDPVVVENLTIDDVPSSASCYALIARLFGVCRPEFLTSYGRTLRCHGRARDDETLGIICKVMQENVFAQFGVKVANTELYEQFRTRWRPVVVGWRPLELKEPLEAAIASASSPKVRFQLTWEYFCRTLDEQQKELDEAGNNEDINQTVGGRRDHKQCPKRDLVKKPVRLRD